MNGADNSSKWCILRTSAARTLGVAASLAAAGFEVWTPKEMQRRRLHRSRKPAEEQAVPIAPSFVFARAAALPDLVRVLSLPINPHPPFSLFRYAGRIPLIADREMSSLREAEEKAARKQRRSQRYIYPRGARVKTDEPAFVGLSGVVEQGDGKHTLVAFNGSFRVKIATWLLRTDDVTNGEPSGIAA